MRRVFRCYLFTMAWASLLMAASLGENVGSLNKYPLPGNLADALQIARLAVQADGAGYRAFNPKQRFNLRLDAQTVSVSTLGGEVFFRLTGWGRAGRLARPENAVVSAQGNRVGYRRGELTEWYVNDGLGLEQGFTVATRPKGGGPLAVALQIEGDLMARLESEKSLVLERDGVAVLHYRALKAWDAAGRVLASRMAVQGKTVRIEVDDSSVRYPVTIDHYLEQAKLTASDGDAGDEFGVVSISGDTALIGGLYSEAAYVFVRTGGVWTEQARLIAPDGGQPNSFGSSVAVDGDTAVIGSADAAYVFVRSGNTWSEQAKLTGWDGFGAVALDVDTIVIGAVSDQHAGYYSGAAYVFVRNDATWSQQAKLIASDGDDNDNFGNSVAIRGDTAVIGANRDEPKGIDSGSVYVFVRSGSTWTEQAKLTAVDGAMSDQFGVSVALSGDTIVIGANGDDYNTGPSGSAYVFLRNAGIWIQQAKLKASDGAPNDYFGSSVSIDGETILIGAPNGRALQSRTGKAYLFFRNGSAWTEQAILAASDGRHDDGFGAPVALNANTALIGAVLDYINGMSIVGSAYVYSLPPTCTLTLQTTYENSTLAVNYTIGNTIPRATLGWLITRDGVTPIWARQIGIVDPPVTDSASITGFAPHGTVGVLGTITQDEKAICADLRWVDTGGPTSGPSIEVLKRIAMEKGLVWP